MGHARKGIRVAVVGCGFIAQSLYAPTLKSQPWISLLAVCDPDDARASYLASLTGAEAFKSLDDLVRAGPDVDLVVNTSPVADHASISQGALLAGMNVYSEKPLALTHDNAESLARLAQEKGLVLFSAPDSSTKKWFQHIASIVDGGLLGEIHSAYARITDAMSHDQPVRAPWHLGSAGGVLRDLGVYPIAELTGLLGPASYLAAITSTTVPHRRTTTGELAPVEAPDTAQLCLRFASGAVASIEASSANGVLEPSILELRGTMGLIRAEGIDPKMINVWLRSGHREALRIESNDPGDNGVIDVARFLAGGSTPTMSTDHAVHVTEVIEATHKSAEKGTVQHLSSRFELIELREGQ